jgi:hypothetical protein
MLMQWQTSITIMCAHCTSLARHPHARHAVRNRTLSGMLQDSKEERAALESSVVAAHKRVVRAEADASVAKQDAAAERATAQALRGELAVNEQQWKQEVATRLSLQEQLGALEQQLDEARKAERKAVTAAEHGWQAQQALLKQAAAQQQRLGNVARLHVRTLFCAQTLQEHRDWLQDMQSPQRALTACVLSIFRAHLA